MFSKDGWIIHLFALLHFAVALGCRAGGIADDLMLTLLTMVMVVVLCLRRPTDITFMAISVILVNLVGFALGMGLAALIGLFASSPLVIHPVSTFLCTEAIGWGSYGAAVQYAGRHPISTGNADKENVRWLLVAFLLIIIIRLMLMFVVSDFEDTRSTLIGILLDYIFSCAALILVAEYAIRTAEKAEAAAAQANLAQYRYMKLKQQVNPHFLFNSLNILDCLIQEQSPEEASQYTHKLADVYRYMIQNEDETVVKLRDEIEFVEKYVDLLKVRWPEGLEVHCDVGQDALPRSVVPCCVQLLIENATKHNAVSPSKPLVIDIRTTDKSVIVSNNICPKVSRSSGTGLGLKYIRQQYKDIAGKSIAVRATEESYTVTLPLL